SPAVFRHELLERTGEVVGGAHRFIHVACSEDATPHGQPRVEPARSPALARSLRHRGPPSATDPTTSCVRGSSRVNGWPMPMLARCRPSTCAAAERPNGVIAALRSSGQSAIRFGRLGGTARMATVSITGCSSDARMIATAYRQTELEAFEQAMRGALDWFD